MHCVVTSKRLARLQAAPSNQPGPAPRSSNAMVLWPEVKGKASTSTSTVGGGRWTRPWPRTELLATSTPTPPHIRLLHACRYFLLLSLAYGLMSNLDIGTEHLRY